MRRTVLIVVTTLSGGLIVGSHYSGGLYLLLSGGLIVGSHYSGGLYL